MARWTLRDNKLLGSTQRHEAGCVRANNILSTVKSVPSVLELCYLKCTKVLRSDGLVLNTTQIHYSSK